MKQRSIPTFVTTEKSKHFNFIDFTNTKKGELLIESYIGKTEKGVHFWSAKCSCGNSIQIRSSGIKKTDSCGCVSLKKASKTNSTHRMRHSSEYRSWIGMRVRILKKTEPSYPRYGGRGITICDSWKNSFESFYADMGPKPSPRHSIDRVDNNAGYCKENCRWATPKQQMRNRSTTVMVEYNEATVALAELCEKFNVDINDVYRRIHLNKWDVHRAITTPIRPKKKNHT